MEMILTGRMMSAKDMFEAGLVTRVVEDEVYLDEAIELGKEIASKPAVAVMLGKECVSRSLDLTIETGLEFERKNFYLLFATEDKFEGLNAFVEKRKAEWKGK